MTKNHYNFKAFDDFLSKFVPHFYEESNIYIIEVPSKGYSKEFSITLISL